MCVWFSLIESDRLISMHSFLVDRSHVVDQSKSIEVNRSRLTSINRSQSKSIEVNRSRSKIYIFLKVWSASINSTITSIDFDWFDQSLRLTSIDFDRLRLLRSVRLTSPGFFHSNFATKIAIKSDILYYKIFRNNHVRTTTRFFIRN